MEHKSNDISPFPLTREYRDAAGGGELVFSNPYILVLGTAICQHLSLHFQREARVRKHIVFSTNSIVHPQFFQYRPPSLCETRRVNKVVFIFVYKFIYPCLLMTVQAS